MNYDQKIEQLAVNDLPNPYGPAPSKELVASVKQHGVLQPIILVSREYDVAIIDGNRRASAAILAKLEHVPVLWVDASEISDAEHAELVIAMNNLRSTNDLAEQSAFNYLLESTSATEWSDIEKRAGLSSAMLSKRKRWFEAHDDLVEAFQAGKIAPTVFDSASKLGLVPQYELVKMMNATGKLTGANVKEVADRYKEPEPVLSAGEQYALAKSAADENIGMMLELSKEMNGAGIVAWLETWLQAAKREADKQSAEQVAEQSSAADDLEVPF